LELCQAAAQLSDGLAVLAVVGAVRLSCPVAGGKKFAGSCSGAAQPAAAAVVAKVVSSGCAALAQRRTRVWEVFLAAACTVTSGSHCMQHMFAEAASMRGLLVVGALLL
jgi:hypothetical protein